MAVMSAMEREWARLGALTRLQKLDAERAGILKTFPELRRGTGPWLSAAGNSLKPKRQFSTAARRRMSAGMRKYWARRRAAAKAEKA